MHGRLLATVDDIICIYTDDTNRSREAVSGWAKKNDVGYTEMEVGEDIDESDFTTARETLGMTLGGDGTFLEGVRQFSSHGIPFLGVKAGSLNFLARVSASDIGDALDEIASGRAEVVDRQQVQVETDGVSATGVNDVMLQPTPPASPVERKIASLTVGVDEEYVGTYTGSGIAIATPTGSTGLSLSANGPIHYPSNNRSLQITPLHTHKMGVRPIIVSNESEITVIPEDEIQLLVDGGRVAKQVSEGDEIHLTGADSRAHVVRTSFDDEFFSAMSQKLGWGLRDADEDSQLLARSANSPTDEEPESVEQKASTVAKEAARSAAEPLREIHGSVEEVTEKTDAADIVTEADYQSQQIISAVIRNEFPSHTVLSEEDWRKMDTFDGYTWIVDPLDGTGNYTHGNPNYSISIALLKDGSPVVGIVHQPETREMFSAIKGNGAFMNGEPISVSDSKSLNRSMVISGYDPQGDFLEAFYDKTRGVRAIGSAALNLCYVASGAADGAWEYDTYPWDVAAGLLILNEAGGTATNQRGETYKLKPDENLSNPLVATNSNIHLNVCEHIGECDICD